MPESRTAASAPSSVRRRERETSPPPGVKRKALASRFSRACLRRKPSPVPSRPGTRSQEKATPLDSAWRAALSPMVEHRAYRSTRHWAKGILPSSSLAIRNRS